MTMKERPIVSEQEMQRQREFMKLVEKLPTRPGSYHIVSMGCQMNWQQKSQRRVHVFLRFRKMF